MKHWTEIVNQLNQENCPYVLATILGVRGSAPRDSGTKMVITLNQSHNTVGGGQLEFKVIELARNMLKKPNAAQHIEYFPLGPKLGQCCGGSTSVLFEYFSPQHAEIMLFGAGHVGLALSKILTELPVKLHWVDNREEQLPEMSTVDDSLSNCRTVLSPSPAYEVETMPADGCYIIMTHDHQLDFELCSAVLKRDDARYIGLIGSTTKWQRFRKRLNSSGFSEQQISTIKCPIGLTDVQGKHPMEVAVSIAGELIADYQSVAGTTHYSSAKQQGIQWTQLSNLKIANSNRATSKKTERVKTCGDCDDCK